MKTIWTFRQSFRRKRKTPSHPLTPLLPSNNKPELELLVSISQSIYPVSSCLATFIFPPKPSFGRWIQESPKANSLCDALVPANVSSLIPKNSLQTRKAFWTLDIHHTPLHPFRPCHLNFPEYTLSPFSYRSFFVYRPTLILPTTGANSCEGRIHTNPPIKQPNN